MDKIKTLIFENSSGKQAILSSPAITRLVELGGRSGFTAPDVETISQKYANGITRVLKRQLMPRSVIVKLIGYESSEAKLDSIFFEMVSTLMDVDGGGIGKLYIQRSDGMTVYLNCTYESGLNAVEEYRRFRTCMLDFYAADPYFYRDAADVIISVENGTFLTLSNSHLFGAHRIGEMTSHGSGKIVNNSGESLQPVLSMNRVIGSVQIRNRTTGKQILLSGLEVYGGSLLVIDTRDSTKNIYIEHTDGTRSPAGQYLDWNNLDLEFPIIPGENVIDYVGGEGSAIEKITFKMSEKFLSA